MLYGIILVWALGVVGFAHLYIQLYPVTIPKYANPSTGVKIGIWVLAALWFITLTVALPLSALLYSIGRAKPFQFGSVYDREATESEAKS